MPSQKVGNLIKKSYTMTRLTMKPKLVTIFELNQFYLVERHISTKNVWTYRVVPKRQSDKTVFYMIVKWDTTRSYDSISSDLGEPGRYPNGAKTLPVNIY